MGKVKDFFTKLLFGSISKRVSFENTVKFSKEDFGELRRNLSVDKDSPFWIEDFGTGYEKDGIKTLNVSRRERDEYGDVVMKNYTEGEYIPERQVLQYNECIIMYLVKYSERMRNYYEQKDNCRHQPTRLKTSRLGSTAESDFA